MNLKESVKSILLLVGLVAALVLVSGCIQEPTPEEKAINLADSHIRGQVVNREDRLNQSMKKCTKEQLLTVSMKLGQPDGLSEEQVKEIQQFDIESKIKCIPELKKVVEKVSDNVYRVTYVFSAEDECHAGVMAYNPLEVNLEDNSVKDIWYSEGSEIIFLGLLSRMESLISTEGPCALVARDILEIDILEDDKKSTGWVKPSPEGVEWIRWYGGALEDDESNVIETDSKDNVIIIGNSENSSGTIIKYDSQGNELWMKSPGIYFKDMAVDNKDNILVVGGRGDFVTIKVDSLGNVLWEKTFDGGYKDIGGVAVDSMDNIIVAGKFKRVFILLKYDSEGNLLWDKSYEAVLPRLEDKVYGVAIDSKNQIIVIGGFNNFFKFDSNGDLLWSKNPAVASPRNLAIDAQDNILVVGSRDVRVSKSDSNGELLWSKLKDADFVHSFGVAINSENNVFSVEWAGSEKNFDIKIIKYDPDGNFIESKRYDGEGHDHGMDIAIDSKNHVLVTGFSQIGGSGSRDFITIKFK